MEYINKDSNRIKLIFDVDKVVNDIHDFETNLMNHYKHINEGFELKDVKTEINEAIRNNDIKLANNLKWFYQGELFAYVLKRKSNKSYENYEYYSTTSDDVDNLEKLFTNILRVNGINKKEINLMFKIANLKFMKAINSNYYDVID